MPKLSAENKSIKMHDAGVAIVNQHIVKAINDMDRNLKEARRLVMTQAKEKFQLGDVVGFTNLSYKGVIVGFNETEQGLCDYNKFPINVCIDKEFINGAPKLISDYHFDQLILEHRPSPILY